MADRFVAVVNVLSRNLKHGALFVLLCGAIVLAGCQAVKMPDMSDFKLKIFEEKPTVAIKSGYTKVNIRPTPSTTQHPIGTLKGGDKVQLIGEQGTWLNVSFYDTTGKEQAGWVYKYLVEGYNKPVETGTASSNVSSRTVVEEATETEAVEIEQEINEQELPKSEKVSPL